MLPGLLIHVCSAYKNTSMIFNAQYLIGPGFSCSAVGCYEIKLQAGHSGCCCSGPLVAPILAPSLSSPFSCSSDLLQFIQY